MPVSRLRAGAGHDGPLWPRLSANIFSKIQTTPEAISALAAFDIVKLERIYSSGVRGGYDYGTRRGLGSYRDVSYPLGNPRMAQDLAVYYAKRQNPDLKVVTHCGINKLDLFNMQFQTSEPWKWFADRLSPKWFVYSPLMALESDQKDPSAVTFRFPTEDLKRAVALYHARGRDCDFWPGPGRHADKYRWQYLCFYDNDAGGGRGSYEIMAIRDIDPEVGRVTVATRKNGSRTCYGRPQSYSKGHRAGILSHSWVHFGTPSVLMNATLFCERVPADPLDPDGPKINWMDANRELIREIFLPACHPAAGAGRVYLCDGILQDADGENARKMYGWTMAHAAGWNGPPHWHADYNLDGRVDGDTDGDGGIDDYAVVSQWFADAYRHYEKGVREDAVLAGRPDFLIMKNGVVRGFPRDLNGRRFEDLDGRFQDADLASAIENYRDMEKPGNLSRPVYIVLNERAPGVENRARYYHLHRRALAITFVFGDGYYGHTGRHALRHRAMLANASQNGADDWMDEFSVDGNGVGCNHPAYSGKTREEFHDWMGAALGPCREIDKEKRTYIRDFEHALAVFSYAPNTITLKGGYRRILGGDDPGFHDGAEVTTLTLGALSGDILFKTTR